MDMSKFWLLSSALHTDQSMLALGTAPPGYQAAHERMKQRAWTVDFIKEGPISILFLIATPVLTNNTYYSVGVPEVSDDER